MKNLIMCFIFILPNFTLAQIGYNNFSTKSFSVNSQNIHSLIVEDIFVSSLIEERVKKFNLQDDISMKIENYMNSYGHLNLKDRIEGKWLIYSDLTSLLPGGGGGGPHALFKNLH